jgi:hypothetical protein
MILCGNWRLELGVKDRQQAPTLGSLLVLKQSLEIKVIMNITSPRYTAIHESYSNTFFTQVGYVALANMFPWVVEKRNSSQNEVIFPISYLSTWSFESFLKQKHSSLYTPQMVLSNPLVVYESLPRHSNVLPSFVFSYF